MQWDLSHAPLRNPRGEKVATMKARAEDEAKAQLQALEAQFYQQFNIPEEVLGRSEDTAAEGHGSVEAEDSTEGDEADDDNDNDEFDDDNDLLAQSTAPHEQSEPQQRMPETVVFAESSAQPVGTSKSARRCFMSSKIEQINTDAKDPAPMPESTSDNDEEDQRDNDRKLTELLSTTLFAPGSSAAGGKKRKLNTTTNETLARVMELSTSDNARSKAAGSGYGEQELRKRELGRMPARMRAGLRRAAGERREREIATQKELGLWNPKLQKQSQLTRGTGTERGTRAAPKQRMRGISSGIGKYRGGMLHLSDSDVQRIRGAGGSGRRGARR